MSDTMIYGSNTITSKPPGGLHVLEGNIFYHDEAWLIISPRNEAEAINEFIYIANV